MRWSSVRRLAVTVLAASIPLALASSQTPKEVLVHKTKYAMGTVFEIAAYDSSPERASRAIDDAFAEVVRLDSVLSDYNPDSELSRLNRTAHFQRQRVSPDLYRVIEQSVQYSRISDGEFDITVAPLVDLWKAALRGDGAVNSREEEKLRDCVGYEKIELTPPDTVEFRSPCMRIDVGSIGKGYAVDRATGVLRAAGIHDALVDAGQSSIYAMGSPPGKTAWEVRLRDPSGHVNASVMLRENSVSTSEQTPASLLGNSGAGHIIDPANGKPLETKYALSVVAKTATASDALSTTLLLEGPDRGRGIVANLPETAALWISSDGTTSKTSTGPEIRIAMIRQKADAADVVTNSREQQ